VGARGPDAGATIDVRIEAEPLHSLTGRPSDPTTPLFNPRLDGDHTYFANGLLVHNKN
jgi:hypothetical protein